MSSSTQKLVIIATLSAGAIIAIGYLILQKVVKVNKKKPADKTLPHEDEKEKEEKDCTINSVKGKHHVTVKTPLEVTTSISLELNKKSDFAITKQANFCMEKVIITKEVIKEIDNEEEEVVTKRRKNSDNLKGKKYKDEESDSVCEDNIGTQRGGPFKSNRTFREKEREFYRKSSSNRERKVHPTNLQNIPSQQNNTILNIVNDLRLVENINNKIKQYAKDNNFDNQGSLYLPVLTNEMSDEFDMNSNSGYMEEDDEDLKDMDLPFDPNNMKDDPLGIDKEFNIDRDFSDIVVKHNQNRKKPSINDEPLEAINNAEDLEQILFNRKLKENNSQSNYNIQTEFRIINNNEKIEIIKEELLLTILKYLYSELHSGLIELSDNFVEQRRAYFEVDHNTYLSIINLFLRKKEEFFLSVLSEIMSRLNISQNLLDNTFVYYMNFANQEDPLIQKIKSDYDKVYRAGIKTTIAPRNLNKTKLKEILEFQCEKYNELIKMYSYELDVIEIMVIDHTYLEYGFDRETIKSAMKKHDVYSDRDFDIYLKKLDEYQKNSFLNI